jgi:CheY-like chemotaxis protein
MNKHVLIIDNDDYTAAKIDEFLKFFGFQTTVTKNGQFGLSSMRSQRPDLILFSEEVKDIDPASFIDRIQKIMGGVKLPVLLISNNVKRGIDLQRTIKDIAATIPKPVPLERLRKEIVSLFRLPESNQDKHLKFEVFIREGIIVVEIAGSLIEHEILALKYRILDTARVNQTLKKRFYIIIYNLEEDNLSQQLFDRLFYFVEYFPHLPESNIKVLTSSQPVTEMLKNSKLASKFEIVDNYIYGLNKLKSLYLADGETEVLVEFLKPEVVLYRNVYDAKSNLIKKEGESFSHVELKDLLKRGIKKLYYIRQAKVGEDKQILPNEDVDIVMDAIDIGGIVIPEEFREFGDQQESKKRVGTNILIVNSNQQDMKVLNEFLSEKGFPVTAVSNSKEAIKITLGNSFDYIIVDLDLDDGNGLNIVRTMKLHPAARKAKFILTGKTVRSESVQQAIQLGVRGFLKSPFNPENLAKIIR